MKHASAHALIKLHSVLQELRAMSALTERSMGCFYRKGAAYLHFHEDGATLFADLKRDGKRFERFCVTTVAEQVSFVALVRGTQQGKN